MKEKTISFFGGVHPTHGEDKALTKDAVITPYVPKNVKVGMKHGLGPACACTVAAGDVVEQGQVIGQAGHFLSVDVHAPVSGKVTAVDETGVTIEVSECRLPDKDAEYNVNWVDISEYTKEQIIEAIKVGGLVGMGGAGFPAHVKYATKDPITHVLINAAECEPFLSCDDHTMMEYGMAFLNGVQLLKKAAGAEHAIICMEDNKAHCKAHLDELLKGHEDVIQVLLLPTKYPQGGEKQLIANAMHVEIPSGKLPANVGAMVSNVQTAKATADMVLGGLASMSRVITVTGDVNTPSNFLCPLGTPISELVGLAGGIKNPNNKVILGGPMTGRCLGTHMTGEEITDTLTKTSGGLIVLEDYEPVESNCIKCGACASACPIGLAPAKIDAAYRKGNIALCQSLNAAECIACGCCSFSCPARRELTQTTVKARDAVKAKMREEAAKRG